MGQETSVARESVFDARHAALVGAQLREIATYLDLEGDRYRGRAYRRAAISVELVPDLERLVRERRLEELPGVGSSLAGVIRSLVERGTVGILDRLRGRWPPGIIELARLTGVGPVRARKIAESLAPHTLEEVAALCRRGAIRELRGFGKVSEARILSAIETRLYKGATVLLPEARALSAGLAAYLRGLEGVGRAEVCGPVRRWIETIDELALAVESDDRDAVARGLRAHPLVVSVDGDEGELRARLSNGLSCAVHVRWSSRFAVARVLATGSADHVAALREHARRQGRELETIAGRDERELYAALGLPFLPPEVRDGTDELSEARAGERFDLVTLADITAAVHCHTTYSDGRDSIAAMARAAGERGLALLTITDHSPSATYAGGLDPQRLAEQWDEIDAVQREVPVRLLRGSESDILSDGSLDHSPELLRRLEIVIASIHKRHRQGEAAMTERLLAAIRQPCFKVWGHPLGRMLLRREPVACRFDELVDAMRGARIAIELNGDPHRLDLDPVRARSAAAAGLAFVLSSDAHSTRDLDHLEYAVAMARRARLRKRDVLNTLPPEEFASRVRPIPA